jgi:hypothetical protein
MRISDTQLVFMTKNVYFEINLECKQVPGRFFGDWFWSDGGNPVNALPPCKVSSFTNISDSYF